MQQQCNPEVREQTFPDLEDPVTVVPPHSTPLQAVGVGAWKICAEVEMYIAQNVGFWLAQHYHARKSTTKGSTAAPQMPLTQRASVVYIPERLQTTQCEHKAPPCKPLALTLLSLNCVIKYLQIYSGQAQQTELTHNF